MDVVMAGLRRAVVASATQAGRAVSVRPAPAVYGHPDTECRGGGGAGRCQSNKASMRCHFALAAGASHLDRSAQDAHCKPCGCVRSTHRLNCLIMKSVYIETSIPSYLTARPSRDVRTAAWQQITVQWWEQARQHYELFTSELVVSEAGEGSPEAAQRRLAALHGIPELVVDSEVVALAAKLIADGGIPAEAEVDALHVAIATVQAVDLLLTWNCRHINNAEMKPVIRSICAMAGYTCPEICTPQELLSEESDAIPG